MIKPSRSNIESSKLLRNPGTVNSSDIDRTAGIIYVLHKDQDTGIIIFLNYKVQFPDHIICAGFLHDSNDQSLEALENGTPILLTEAVGFYEYVRDIDQDYVKKIDLADQRVEMREFLCRGGARSGLGHLETIFDADKIRQQLLDVLIPGDGSRTDRNCETQSSLC